jgi:hypothetical protein
MLGLEKLVGAGEEFMKAQINSANVCTIIGVCHLMKLDASLQFQATNYLHQNASSILARKEISHLPRESMVGLLTAGIDCVTEEDRFQGIVTWGDENKGKNMLSESIADMLSLICFSGMDPVFLQQTVLPTGLLPNAMGDPEQKRVISGSSRKRPLDNVAAVNGAGRPSKVQINLAHSPVSVVASVDSTVEALLALNGASSGSVRSGLIRSGLVRSASVRSALICDPLGLNGGSSTCTDGGSLALTVSPSALAGPSEPITKDLIDKRRERNRVAAKLSRIRKKLFIEWLMSRAQQLEQEKQFIIGTFASVQSEKDHRKTMSSIQADVVNARIFVKSEQESPAGVSMGGGPSNNLQKALTDAGAHKAHVDRLRAKENRDRKRLFYDSLKKKVDIQQVEVGCYRNALGAEFGVQFAKELLSRFHPSAIPKEPKNRTIEPKNRTIIAQPGSVPKGKHNAMPGTFPKGNAMEAGAPAGTARTAVTSCGIVQAKSRNIGQY